MSYLSLKSSKVFRYCQCREPEGTAKIKCLLRLGVLPLLFCAGNLLADEIRVAVATNFADAVREVAARFESKSSHKVILVFGSTGKHYAQIKHGAPFDVFFAADERRPMLLEQEGLALPGSRFTYAVGKLVLWSPATDLVGREGDILNTDNFRFVALANPKLAPYGKAAEQVLRRLGQWHALQGRMVRGENIGQTFQFVSSGNAELGFVAASQVNNPDKPVGGSFWLVPSSLYDPIEQQAVLLRDNDVAREFLAFMKGGEAVGIIRRFGYSQP